MKHLKSIMMAYTRMKMINNKLFTIDISFKIFIKSQKYYNCWGHCSAVQRLPPIKHSFLS